MNHLGIDLGGTGRKSIRALRKQIFAEQILPTQSMPRIDFYM
jgi:hypothetical protein